MNKPQSRVDCAQESAIPDGGEEPQLEARFECPICLNCLNEAVLTSCGHRFCKSCIYEWLERESECPVDNQLLRRDTDIFPDNFTRREIQQLVRADKFGAQVWEKQIDAQMEAAAKEEKGIALCKGHLIDGIPYITVVGDGGWSKRSYGHSYSGSSGVHDEEASLVECSFKEVGCTVTVPRGQLAEHLEKDVQHHLNLLSGAYGKLSMAHQQQQAAVKAQEAEHLWQPDPKHSTNSTAPDKPRQEPLALVRSLYERVVVLEQRNREQDIQLRNMQRQFSASLDSMAQELSLRHCGGTYVWLLPRFAARLADMKAQPTRCSLYSPGFYTAPCGYRFCARLNLSQNDHNYLALLVHLMRGDNDVLLEWPFMGCITFELVSARRPQDNLRECVVTRPDLQAFHRPRGNVNQKGFGYTEFVSLTDLEAQFLHADTLTIRLSVQSIK